jgi:hypothetical protein
MNISTFRDNTMMLVNELIAANKKATLETWPSLRDEVLDRHGLKETLGFMEYDPSVQ